MKNRMETELKLSTEDKRYLLELARKVIRAKCSGSSFDPEPPVSPVLNEKRGAFVTLNEQGQLRGCIGYIEGIKPLYQSIMEMAEAAAFNDPRFPPVQAEEVDDLEIEISVLSPLRRIKNIDEIKIGTHGILMKKKHFQGLLLPQVATHYNWDRETFLLQTCIKAGLPSGCRHDPEVEIWIFSASIFSEEEFFGGISRS